MYKSKAVSIRKLVGDEVPAYSSWDGIYEVTLKKNITYTNPVNRCRVSIKKDSVFFMYVQKTYHKGGAYKRAKVLGVGRATAYLDFYECMGPNYPTMEEDRETELAEACTGQLLMHASMCEKATDSSGNSFGADRAVQNYANFGIEYLPEKKVAKSNGKAV